MKGTPITEAIVEYSTRLFPAEDDLLRDLRADAIRSGLPEIQIAPDQAAFMGMFLRAIGARRVAEVGTLGGYSAIVMARALPTDGMVATIERDPFRADFARGWAERAGLSDRIRVYTGAGSDVIEKEFGALAPFDFAFLDADKPGYVRYLELLLPMMRPGGVIAGDNAIAGGRIAEDHPDNDTVQGMQAFNRAMSENPRIDAALVPIGDGMCMGVVKGA